MEGIKYVNLIEIGPVVIEIRRAENGELAVPVNNTLVSHMAFLAADTRLCVLMNNLVLQLLHCKTCYWSELFCKRLQNLYLYISNHI